MLYYFTASDGSAQKHWQDTIQNPYPISTHLTDLDTNTVTKLKDNGLHERVHMWGAIPGSSNIKRWGKLKEGDRILAYSKGEFHFYGTIFAKAHNPDVAKKVWGTNNKGETWEYIYFIKDLIPVSIKAIEFAAFFGYKLNFTPQGFSNIDSTKLEIKLTKYKTIDNIIKGLNENFILSEDEQEEDMYQANIDSDYNKIKVVEEERPEKRKKPKVESGKKVWPRDPKKAKQAIKQAEFKCEIDDTHETFVSEASRENFMEAHHLIPLKMQHEFEYSLDVAANIISICPNCHRSIHYGRAKDKKKVLELLFEKRRDSLKKCGIEVSIEELLGYYEILK
ncbi:HNH endonuclease [Bacillus paramycoides]|uniref:HNH endonuclease n=1 Tax=Bacillus paramycoides TaxID=2026194 RepID=UPI002E1B3CE2|nr:HNH endonuclease [Bacillus paramycoides]MED0983028.1 HNH endonuclease [Bacillus paramycoides]